MKYTAIMKLEDGRSYVEQSDKLTTAEHFYDCFVENGIKSGQGFYVALKEGDKTIWSHDGTHTL